MRNYIENESVPLEFRIEAMVPGDLAEVVELEQLTGLSPWGFNAYQRELIDNPHAVMLVVRPAQAAESARRVIAFLCSNVVLDEWHINNLATHPEFRRKGAARALLQSGAELASSGGAQFGLLEVRASNYAAQVLYIKLGFRIVARRRCYYGNPVEDAIVLRAELSQPGHPALI